MTNWAHPKALIRRSRYLCNPILFDMHLSHTIASVFPLGISMAKRFLATACILISAAGVFAQIEDPVTWDVNLYPSAEEGLHDLVIHATVDSCWHIYSQDNDPNNGPVPTMFEFEWPQGIAPQGAVQECKPLEEYDPNFMMDLKYFEEEVY